MQESLIEEHQHHHAEDSCTTQSQSSDQEPDSPETVDQQVRELLGKLNQENFDSISEQILELASRSINEVDNRTITQVTLSVFEHAINDADSSETHARLFQFLIDHLCHDAPNEEMGNVDRTPIPGRNLVQKYLIYRCQEAFEEVWDDLESETLAARTAEDKAVGNEYNVESNRNSSLQTVRHRALSIIEFFGELFKQRILSERIMHECVQKLLMNGENPVEEELESLCVLFATVGQSLDTPKARNLMNIYFAQMAQLANSEQISSRIHFMLLVGRLNLVNSLVTYLRRTLLSSERGDGILNDRLLILRLCHNSELITSPSQTPNEVADLEKEHRRSEEQGIHNCMQDASEIHVIYIG